jgi:hypothetical protein
MAMAAYHGFSNSLLCRGFKLVIATTAFLDAFIKLYSWACQARASDNFH